MKAVAVAWLTSQMQTYKPHAYRKPHVKVTFNIVQSCHLQPQGLLLVAGQVPLWNSLGNTRVAILYSRDLPKDWTLVSYIGWQDSLTTEQPVKPGHN